MHKKHYIALQQALLLILLLFTTQENVLFAQNKEKASSTKMEIPIYEEAPYKQHIVHKGFELVFDENARIPEWTAYELTAEEVAGTAPRGRHFDIDPEVHGVQADNEDYRNTGWDRGHMVPAGDMKLDDQMMRESFYFSNICPQNRNLNGGDWKTLEELCRIYAQRYEKVFIVCGPIIGNNLYGRLGPHQVIIPDAFFKVLLVETKNGYASIGFIMNNEAGHKPLTTYVRTVDEVEEITGLDFFSLLPDKVEKKVEATYDLSVWNL
jgi:endonuclease G